MAIQSGARRAEAKAIPDGHLADAASRDRWPVGLDPKKVVAVHRGRVVATRTAGGWHLAARVEPRLHSELAKVTPLWNVHSRSGDRIRWYLELAAADGWGIGGEGVRLVRGTKVLADVRLATYD